MIIKISKKRLIEALEVFMPNDESFMIHNEGEYGEIIMSLWTEEKEDDEFFQDFLAYCREKGELR